jgi:hypothetical protein
MGDHDAAHIGGWAISGLIALARSCCYGISESDGAG